MNKKIFVGFSGLITVSMVAVCAAIASNNKTGFFLPQHSFLQEGPTEKINSVSFYENAAVEALYGSNHEGEYAGYKREQSIEISGGTWVVSGATYGKDNPVHLGDAAEYNTLFRSDIWDQNIGIDYGTGSASMTYSADYSDIKTHVDGSLIWNMVLMSTTTYTNVENLGIFWRYTTTNIGIKPFYKVKGESNWQPIAYDVEGTNYEFYSFNTGLLLRSDGSVSSSTSRIQQDYIDYSPYDRYYDGCAYYNDDVKNVLSGKEVYLAFFIGGSANYFMDMQIDGIVVNRHQTAMKFMNYLDDQSICSSGSITDPNIKKCFELLDRSFDTYSASGSDVSELADYSINHELYPNLRENNYYSQYQYLKSYLA